MVKEDWRSNEELVVQIYQSEKGLKTFSKHQGSHQTVVKATEEDKEPNWVACQDYSKESPTRDQEMIQIAANEC